MNIEVHPIGIQCAAGGRILALICLIVFTATGIGRGGYIEGAGPN